MSGARWLSAVALLAACGQGGPAPVSPEMAEQLRAHRDPRTWDVLDPGRPGGPALRVRDPRTGIAFVLVPAGEFTMGGRQDAERPQHLVRISHPLYFSQTEVTAAQWRRHVAEHGGDPGVPVGDAADDHPAGGLSWKDAVRFCETYGYRLPTEAEWEYACRGGAIDAGAFWNDPVALNDYSWSGANAGGDAHPVATRRPNGFGLHDMLGGLWEWCADWLGQGYAVDDPKTATVDPQGPSTGDLRCLRGGSWLTLPPARPTDRSGDYPTSRSEFYGLRVVQPLPR